MALTDFKVGFDNSYQEFFNKKPVAKEVMNMRLEPMLTYGGSVTRVAMDLSNVLVRTTVRGSAATIDTVTDTAEALTVNIEKEAWAHVSDGEVTQTGPLKAMQTIGKELAIKLANNLDGLCFAEVLNATLSFDNGDLTTGTSSGTPITLSATTVPQMSSRMSAKLASQNKVDISSNMALVVDFYAASDINQFLISKNIDLAEYVFKNGYAGPVDGSAVYISESLTSTSVLSIATTPTDGDTVTIAGVTFTFKTTLGSTAGNVAIAGSADAARLNLSELINDPDVTDAGQVALSAADQITMNQYVSTDSASANTLTIVGTGTGRTYVSETLTDATDAWTKNYINCYYGKKGAIDLVVQDGVSSEMLRTTDRRGTNICASYLAGLKTFADGKKKMLNVKILVA